MPFVKKDVEEYYYSQMGKPESESTLVFVHGATMTGDGLAPFAEQFKDFNCIVVDLPGHGRSVGPSKERVEDFADGVEYLIKSLMQSGVISNHVTVVGYSMGGCIAVELALRELEGLKRIVVLNSGACLAGHTQLLVDFGKKEQKDYHTEDLYDHIFGKYTTPEGKKESIQFLMNVKAEENIGQVDLMTASLYDRQDETSGIKIPVLILAGDEDELIPIDIPTKLRNSVPNSALHVFPYRGHAAVFEETELAVNTLLHFFCYNP